MKSKVEDLGVMPSKNSKKNDNSYDDLKESDFDLINKE
jgi:hypothetical protein